MRTQHGDRVSEVLEAYDVPEISAKRVRLKIPGLASPGLTCSPRSTRHRPTSVRQSEGSKEALKGAPGKRPGMVLVSAAVIADAVMLCVSAVPKAGAVTAVLLMAVSFVFGVAGQVVDVTVMAVRQAITPVELQGRVVATMNLVAMGLTPLGSLLGGVVAAQWGLWASMLLTAVALALSPLFMALSPRARLGKTLPHP